MKVGRYKFVDWFGIPKGIENTDDLQKAKGLALEFQCEVIDIQDDNRPIFNCWSGDLLSESEDEFERES